MLLFTFKAGSNVEMAVGVLGKPKPSVIWTHNNREVSTSVNILTAYENNKSSMKIKNASRNDSGVYEVSAENSLGKRY